MHEGPVVVFSGGGTGGHLYPALAIADALRELRPDAHVVFFGAERGLEARVLPERREHHYLFRVHGVDRAHPLRSWRAVTGLVGALVGTARVFTELRPEVVVVTGGYAGAPAGIVAGLMGVTLVLQEQNSVPGVVTRLLTRWARRVHVAYAAAGARLPLLGDRVRLSGNPVRSRPTRDAADVRAELGIPGHATLVLVTGGSQGSLALNDVLGHALRGCADGSLVRPDALHVLWVSGPKHIGVAEELLDECGNPEWVHAVAYVDDMPSVLTAADVAVSRAGAMFTAELLNAGLPAVLVPLPSSAEGHQRANACALEAAGAAVVAPESTLTGPRLWGEILGLLASPERLEGMRRAARALARPEAAKVIAADIAALLSSPGDVG